MGFFLFLIFIYLFIIIFLLKLINSAAQNHCLPRQKDAYDVCMYVCRPYACMHVHMNMYACTYKAIKYNDGSCKKDLKERIGKTPIINTIWKYHNLTKMVKVNFL